MPVTGRNRPANFTWSHCEGGNSGTARYELGRPEPRMPRDRAGCHRAPMPRPHRTEVGMPEVGVEPTRF